jgi:hypothetical protein
MAEESEKRFHAIMDKLFQTPPKSKSATASPSTSSVQLSRGKKRPDSETALALTEPSSLSSGKTVKAPLCRPWDREDLLKRLATFKSLTWFAKPEVVSAVNCARRGWINVDSDIIACETCGSRLQFSSPSSWTQQQVDKAALVFSLKLNNGHKLLCAWVDNACDEKLAQFPPMTSVDLANNYQKRVASLLQLSALPLISSSAVDHIRNPQLDHFLKEFSAAEFDKNISIDSSTTEFLGNEPEAVSSNSYYQALKIISLCGWEPRILPYTVNYKDQEKLSSPPHAVGNANSPSNMSVYTSAADKNVEDKDNNHVSTDVKYDPSSVVLDCKLCGASIGLWVFSTASPPLEFLRLVGSSETNGESSTNHAETNEICSTSFAVTKPSFNMTIAGGPSPAKQNFRPSISVPVIGRNLRARISSESEIGNSEIVALGSDKQEMSDNAVGDPCSSEVGNSSNTTIVDSVLNESDVATLNDSQLTEINQDGQDKVQPVSNSIVPYSTGKDANQEKPGTSMEFDPIRQHRHFCPWIASIGNSLPGWQQTLSALLRQKDSSYASPPNPPSTSLIKVDDPVGSVKKLFMSPSAKKQKCTPK